MFSTIANVELNNDVSQPHCRSVGHPYYFSRRETNSFPRLHRPNSKAIAKLYSNLRPFSRSNADSLFGATFGLDFSTDGYMLWCVNFCLLELIKKLIIFVKLIKTYEKLIKFIFLIFYRSVLGAAMEKCGLLFFDALSRQRIMCIPNAHSDCTNAIKFV